MSDAWDRCLQALSKTTRAKRAPSHRHARDILILLANWG